MSAAVTAADLRLALARLLLLSMWQADETDEGNVEAIEAVNAEIESIAPMFTGIMSRQQLTDWITYMNFDEAQERARAAALLVCEAAA